MKNMEKIQMNYGFACVRWIAWNDIAYIKGITVNDCILCLLHFSGVQKFDALRLPYVLQMLKKG